MELGCDERMMPGKLSHSLSLQPMDEPVGPSARPGRGGTAPFDARSLVTRAHYLLNVSHRVPLGGPPHPLPGGGSASLPGGRTWNREGPRHEPPGTQEELGLSLFSFLEKLVEQGRGEEGAGEWEGESFVQVPGLLRHGWQRRGTWECLPVHRGENPALSRPH